MTIMTKYTKNANLGTASLHPCFYMAWRHHSPPGQSSDSASDLHKLLALIGGRSTVALTVLRENY